MKGDAEAVAVPKRYSVSNKFTTSRDIPCGIVAVACNARVETRVGLTSEDTRGRTTRKAMTVQLR